MRIKHKRTSGHGYVYDVEFDQNGFTVSRDGVIKRKSGDFISCTYSPQVMTQRHKNMALKVIEELRDMTE